MAAVSPDGATLYVVGEGPQHPNSFVLFSIDASTGEPVSAIPGVGNSDGLFNCKVLLTPDGTVAFTMCDDGNSGANLATKIDLTTQAVVDYIYAANRQFVDMALSPDGSQLFLSVEPYLPGAGAAARQFPNADVPTYACRGKQTICAFNTSTFALSGQVHGLYGNLSVSQDGASLYVISHSVFPPALYAVNTSKFTLSRISLPAAFSIAVVAGAPSGNQAIAVGSTDLQGFQEVLLDTKTNTVAGTVQTPPIPPGSGVAQGSNVAAFSEDGTSLWTLLCTSGGCPQTLLGQSFPSGNLIAEPVLPPVESFVGVSF